MSSITHTTTTTTTANNTTTNNYYRCDTTTSSQSSSHQQPQHDATTHHIIASMQEDHVGRHVLEQLQRIAEATRRHCAWQETNQRVLESIAEEVNGFCRSIAPHITITISKPQSTSTAPSLPPPPPLAASPAASRRAPFSSSSSVEQAITSLHGMPLASLPREFDALMDGLCEHLVEPMNTGSPTKKKTVSNTVVVAAQMYLCLHELICIVTTTTGDKDGTLPQPPLPAPPSRGGPDHHAVSSYRRNMYDEQSTTSTNNNDLRNSRWLVSQSSFFAHPHGAQRTRSLLLALRTHADELSRAMWECLDGSRRHNNKMEAEEEGDAGWNRYRFAVDNGCRVLDRLLALRLGGY